MGLVSILIASIGLLLINKVAFVHYELTECIMFTYQYLFK
jgi:hypothetical protein